MFETYSADELKRQRASLHYRLNLCKRRRMACRLYLIELTDNISKSMRYYLYTLERGNKHTGEYLIGTLVMAALALLMVGLALLTPAPATLMLLMYVAVTTSGLLYTMYHVNRRQIERTKQQIRNQHLDRLERQIQELQKQVNHIDRNLQEHHQEEEPEHEEWEPGRFRFNFRRHRRHGRGRGRSHFRRREQGRYYREQARDAHSHHRRSQQDGGKQAKIEKDRSAQIRDALSLLDLGNNPTFDQIRKSYRRKIINNHPDRVAHLSDEEQKKAKELTIRLNRAYALLKKHYKEPSG